MAANKVITTALLSRDATRLLAMKNKGKPLVKSPEGRPLLTEPVYRRAVANAHTRIEAVLELLKYYYLKPLRHKHKQAYELNLWSDHPDITPEEASPTPTAMMLAEAFSTTVDPSVATGLLNEHTEAVFRDVLHPHVQLKWKEQLDRAENDPAVNQKRNPVVRHLLTQEGQAMWFVQRAMDANIEVQHRIKAMVQAGQIQGHYSDKIKLLHQGLPDTQPQQITNNIMVGTDLANKFRLFLQDKLKQLPSPDSDEHEEADIIDVEPEPTSTPEPKLPDFLS